MSARTFTTGQVSELLGVSIQRLKRWRYGRSPLCAPSGFTGGGHARYTEFDVARLQKIIDGLDAGASLQELRGSKLKRRLDAEG